MVPVSPPEQLQRAIGPRALAFATVNAVVGSGIFVLPALVGEGLGAAAILAYLVCGALIFMISLCFAELGSGTTVSGGLHTYIGQAFGSFAGYLAGNIYWLGGAVMADAAISNGLADILGGFFPAMSAGIFRVLFIMMLFAGLATLNISSVKRGIRFVEFATLGKLIPLIVLVLVAAPLVEPANLQWTITPDVDNVGAASLLLFFAFLGMETPLSNGGEMKDPRRTVPRGLLLGILLVLLIYISIQLVTQGMLGAELQAHKASPLGAVAGLAIGASGLLIIVLVSFISMTGCMAGNILGTPRILYAAGRDGTMPKPLARVHSRYFTPHIAILVYIVIGCTLALTGEFRQLAIISSAAALIIYLGIVLAVLKLRLRPGSAVAGAFRAPGSVFLPTTAACGILWLLSNLSRQEMIGMGIFVGVLSVLYAIGMQFRKRVTSNAFEVTGSDTLSEPIHIEP